MVLTNNNIHMTSDGVNVRNKYLFLTIIHILQVALANYLALVINFKTVFLSFYLNKLWPYISILIVIRLGLYLQAGVYKNDLHSSGVHDLIKILKTIAFGSITFLIVIRYLIGDTLYPISVYILDLLLLLIFSGGLRLTLMVCSPRK